MNYGISIPNKPTAANIVRACSSGVIAQLSLLMAVLFVTGCGADTLLEQTASSRTIHVSGMAHGGQQPISGATIQLWSVGTTSDGSAATKLISTKLTTSDGTGAMNANANTGNANNTLPAGAFELPSGWPCGAGTYVYLTATGGNPNSAAAGLPSNPQLALMALLGNCGNLNSNTYVSMNELTTVASLAPLAQWTSIAGSFGSIGSASTDAPNFQAAMGLVAQYVNTANGTVPGSALASGYSASSAQITSLANAIASCVNSGGGAAGDGSACGLLFTATTVGGVKPVDTIGALISIFVNPNNNVSGIFSLAPAASPYQPTLTAAPTNWATTITPTVAIPVFIPAGTALSASTPIYITDSTPNTTVIYTTDGSTPSASHGTMCTPSSTVACLTMPATGGTLKAIAETSSAVFSPSVATITYAALSTQCPGPSSTTDWLISDSTKTHVTIQSMGATLGITCSGGGSANYLDVNGSGTNIMNDGYGREWQPALHFGQYNPTQAGTVDQYGAPASVSLGASAHGNGQRVTIAPFYLPLYENQNEDCFVVADFDPLCPVDENGISDSALSAKAQSTSELTFTGYFEDASALANNTIPVFKFHWTMTFVHDPGAPNNAGATQWDSTLADYSGIYQFGPLAKKVDGSAAYPADLGNLIGTGQNFTPYPATYIDLAKSVIADGFRLDLSAGYTNVMYVNSSGSWVTQSENLQDGSTSPSIPDVYSTDSKTATVNYAFAVLENPTTGQAVGIYYPQNDPANSLQIIGTNISTGSTIYSEDRRTEVTMTSGALVGVPNRTLDGVSTENQAVTLHPVLDISGLLAPNHSKTGVMEGVTSDQYLLIGTPAQIYTAVQAISVNSSKSGW